MKARLSTLPPPPPELSIYRNHTIALLRRYFGMSVEVGRLPAILGRELFPMRSTNMHVHSFEDTVLFVIDVEHCLDRLDPFDKELIARIILQEYSADQVGRLLHCGLRTVERRLADALDKLTEMFLKKRLLQIAEELRGKLIKDDDQFYPRHLPQRATRVRYLHACADVSQFETPVVKPPFRHISLQTAAAAENIISADVAGLPPSVCYAGFVS